MMSDVEDDPVDLAGFKKARTKAFKRLRKSVERVTVGVKKNQDSVHKNFLLMEDSFCDFYTAHTEMVRYCKQNKVPETVLAESDPKDTSIVNGKSLSAYFSDVQTEYDTCVKTYNDYKLSCVTASLDTPVTPNSVSVSASPVSSSNVAGHNFLYQKKSYPSFSGKPGKDWLEWKVVVEAEVGPLFRDRPVVLAGLYRDMCKGGPAEKVIEHVSLAEADCSSKMWGSLLAHYDNIGVNIQVVLNEFHTLKPCNEPLGILQTMRKIKGAHSQLVSYGHTSQVDQSLVTGLVELFPSNIQEGWYEKFSTLDETTKFHPFDEFVDFLDTKTKAIEAMATCVKAKQMLKTPSRQSSSRSNTVFSTSVEGCPYHPNQQHSLRECRHFGKLSAREKAAACTDHKRCKLCLSAKHDGQCDGRYECGFCKGDARRRHCELLCFKKEQQLTGNNDSVSKPYGRSNGKNFNPPNSSGQIHAVDSNAQTHGNATPSNVANQPMVFLPHQLYNTMPQAHGNVSNPTAFSQPMAVLPHQLYNPMLNFPTNNSGTIQHIGPSVSQGAPMPMMPFLYGGYPTPQSSPLVGHDGSNVTVSNGPGASNGPGPAHEPGSSNVESTSANSKPGAIINKPSATKSSAGNNHVDLSSHLSNMQVNLFQVSETSHQSELEELPFYDNILTAPRGKAFGLYAIISAPVHESKKRAVLFMDSGSDTSLFLESSIEKLNARVLAHGNIKMSTLHGTETRPTRMVEVNLIDHAGAKRPVVGYTVTSICSKPYQLKTKVLETEFPEFDPKFLRRPSQEVDILLGSDYFAYFPKQEVARNKDLSIMMGVFGKCVQGSHPSIVQRSKAHPYTNAHIKFEAASYGVTVRGDIPSHTHLLTGSAPPPPSGPEVEIPGPEVEPESAPPRSPTLVEVPGTSPLAPGVMQDAAAPLPCRKSADDLSLVATVGDVVPPGVPPEAKEVPFPPSEEEEAPYGPLGDPCGLASPPTMADFVVHSPCSPVGASVVVAGNGGPSSSSPGVNHLSGLANSFSLTGGDFGPALDAFILGEHLGTTCFPRCGACRCGKCPLPGHSFSFKEEQELQLIQSKLRYLKDPGRWITGYPWVVDPHSLPDNYVAAYSTLCRTEKTLAKDAAWQSTYQLQIDDHEKRGVARKLSSAEIAEWSGPIFYLSHMALEQPKSESTPVRLVFNSSQKYRGVSLNSCLAKGPDCYNCTLIGMLIRFREYSTVLIGDIRKMYNTVWLEELEQHMHRFLWRSCETDRKPDVWVITRVNLGDKPSGTIAITAKNNTAHMFSEICPEAAQILIYSCYTDDIITSIQEGVQHAQFLAGKCEEILSRGEFKVKCWFYGGSTVPEELKAEKPKQVLGVFYDMRRDVIMFPVKLNFSPKRRNVPTGPDLQFQDVPQSIPLDLTRRTVLQQVMAIYDPLGLLSPLVLQAKLLLRDTWLLKLGWDEVLTPEMLTEWRKFFMSLFDASHISFDRCLTPQGAVGRPSLVLLSDGSEVAYGCAAYVRWELADGTFWCRLIMAKSRIAPVNRVSIPRMELNGAVVNKRLRDVITEESRLEFEKVHHIIDSETVLCQLYKVASKFQVFEGVRIGEIQAAMNGDMTQWAWVAGTSNVADLTTRPQPPSALAEGSEWQNGPSWLYLPESQWPVKRNPHVNVSSPGEKAFSHKVSVCPVHELIHSSFFADSLKRCGSTEVTVGAMARIISALRAKSFRGSASGITPELRRYAFKLALQEAQCTAWKTAKDVTQQFCQIRPVVEEGVWTVGSRDPRKYILSPDFKPQVLLPPKHILTLRLMIDSHNQCGHGGRDRSLSRFRARFYTSRASKLAERVCSQCQKCKLLKVKLLEQRMGCLPPERFTPSAPFDSSVLDLFGPYEIRDAVNRRGTSKVWGVIFVDLSCRAVHIEIAAGYDTDNFLLAFQRFSALRGWPSFVYSDPGTQLKGASGEVTQPWTILGTEGVITALARSGTRWIFGPADSPWYQGAAESLIKSAKSSINQAIKGKRFGLSQLLTIFTQSANLLNERPIGFMPGIDNPITILTPNNLLLGRSTAANPGGSETLTPTIEKRLTAVRDAVDVFWYHWTELYAPTLISQAKWLHETRPLQEGDVVLVADSNVMKGEYRVAIVHAVHPSKDGLVRRVSIRYMIYRTLTADMKLRDGRPSIVERSVQRLALLVPVNEGK